MQTVMKSFGSTNNSAFAVSPCCRLEWGRETTGQLLSFCHETKKVSNIEHIKHQRGHAKETYGKSILPCSRLPAWRLGCQKAVASR